MARRQKIAAMLPLLAFLSTFSLTASCAAAQTQTWYLDPPHSAAQFSVRHMGISNIRGTFTKVNGVVVDSPDLSKASVNITIDASSVDSRVQMRDDDLRSDHFFDVARYPTITFQSKRVESAGPGKLKITGDLTIHGVTKEAVLDVDGPTPPVKDPRGKSHRGVSATTTISRADYGMNADPGMIGDQVAIQIDVEMVDQAPGAPRPAAPPRTPPAM
ncbi:MAG TPA: YceI family protein [Acidobacteriaceae bacterium]|nr:YceI family protein [Acidobacteriaceae bacterium]